jgi:hypothetical protein
LNQDCVPAADVESMLLSRMLKILLQQYRPVRDVTPAATRAAAIEGTADMLARTTHRATGPILARMGGSASLRALGC